MNPEMQKQVDHMILLLKNFGMVVEAAAMKNDGMIDKNERKIIDKIQKATNKYIKELNNL